MEGRFDRNCVEKYLPSNLDYKIVESNDNRVIVRTTFSTPEESHEWITNFGLKSDAQYTSRGKNESKIFSKTYFCKRSNKDKKIVPTDQQYNSLKHAATDCRHKVTLRIKVITKDTKKKDKLLRRDNPLVGEAMFLHGHNHLCGNAEMLSFLKPTPEVREMVEERFAEGDRVSNVRELLAENLTEKEYASARVNPKQTQICQLIYRICQK
jgi:hypothetical protein